MYQTDEASNDTGRFLQIIDSDAKDLLSRANPPPNPKKTGGSNYNANSYSGYEESDNRPSKYGGYKANSGYEENESKYGGYNKAYTGYEENESKQSKYGGYNKTYSGYEENENRSSKYGGYKANSAYSGYGNNENKSSNYNNYDSYQNNDFGKDPYSNENHDHGYSKQQSSNSNDQVVPSVQEIYYSNSTNFLKTANNDSSLNSTALNVQPNTSQPPPPPPQSQLLMRSENDLPDKTDYLNPKPDKTYAYAQMDYATNPGAIKDFNGYERLDYDQVLSSVQINSGLEITHVFLDYSSRNELHEITLQLMEAVTLDRIVLAIQRDDQLAETNSSTAQNLKEYVESQELQKMLF
ncbi:hypothetical protein RDWZM_000382 [Blomia tropicalis]|uniref:Uncharacterized protein n=1 Tax=Blomia tropicalis TaxID=40697 RepID=A0A9Q0MCP4_BLOTA|nr:hypothetical protein RDWZM_000382 [Blomia tropicalis]